MPTTIQEQDHTARKELICDWCGCEIHPGEQYHRATLRDGESIYEWRSHKECDCAVKELEMDEYGEGLSGNDFKSYVRQYIADEIPKDIQKKLLNLPCIDQVKTILKNIKK